MENRLNPSLRATHERDVNEYISNLIFLSEFDNVMANGLRAAKHIMIVVLPLSWLQRMFSAVKFNFISAKTEYSHAV